jgi:hypothetical protein
MPGTPGVTSKILGRLSTMLSASQPMQCSRWVMLSKRQRQQLRRLLVPDARALVSVLPSDQQAIVQTIVEKGMVVTTLGPEIGIYNLTVLGAPTGDVNKDDVPVQIVDAPPTNNKYSIDFQTSGCMAQLQIGTVQIYSKIKPSFWDAPIKAGDVVEAKASVCSEYNTLDGVKNITSATIKITGASENQLAPDDGKSYRYMLIGQPA